MVGRVTVPTIYDFQPGRRGTGGAHFDRVAEFLVQLGQGGRPEHYLVWFVKRVPR
jgi:hypothetical protein